MTPAASDDEAAAVALLASFKAASVSMFSFVEAEGGDANADLALSCTECADPNPTDEPTDEPAKSPDDGASAMTTFAVAIAAAVAALF